MPKTRAGTAEAKAAETKPVDTDQPVASLRIDAPHTITGQPAPEAVDLPEIVAALADARVEIGAESIRGPLQELALREEQLQLQAAQLAGHLKARLSEVDRREAQLN